MCGRFYVDDDTAREIEKIAEKIDGKRAKVGEVYPSELALVLKADSGRMVSQALKWGYEVRGKNGIIFNARSETVREKPMFRSDYESRRCIIPVKEFYEWKRNGNRRKEKYSFFADGKLLFLAGICHEDPEGGRFTILTRQAQGCMEEIHNRMPLILTEGDLKKWLFFKEDAGKLLDRHFEKLQRKRSEGEEYEQLSLV